jgi:hypothetical protein
MVLEQADKLDCKRYLSPKDITEGSPNLNLAFVAQIFQHRWELLFEGILILRLVYWIFQQIFHQSRMHFYMQKWIDYWHKTDQSHAVSVARWYYIIQRRKNLQNVDQQPRNCDVREQLVWRCSKRVSLQQRWAAFVCKWMINVNSCAGGFF